MGNWPAFSELLAWAPSAIEIPDKEHGFVSLSEEPKELAEPFADPPFFQTQARSTGSLIDVRSLRS